MNGVCGIQQRACAERRWRRFGIRSCAAVIAVTLGLAVPATGAASGGMSGGNRPRPQALWHAYPLNPAHSGSTPAPGANAGTTPGKSPPANHSRSPAKRSDGGTFPTLWIVVGGALVPVLLAASVLARRVAVHADRRPDLPQSHPRLGRLAKVALRSIGRLRVPPLPRRRGGLLAPAAAAHGLADVLMDNVRRLEQPREVATEHNNVAATGAERTPAEHGSRPEPSPAKRLNRQSNPVLTPDRLVALEQATLKRKQAARSANDADTIKAKTRPSTGAKPAKSDVKKLRTKLVESRGAIKKPAQSPFDPPQRPVKDLRAERSFTQLAPQSPKCRIAWWRGYVKSEFHAKVRMPDGREHVVRTSPGFRWSKSAPPPKGAPQVAYAHQTLIDQLAADGWFVSGGGAHAEWWALELKRRNEEPNERQKGATWPPTRTSSG